MITCCRLHSLLNDTGFYNTLIATH